MSEERGDLDLNELWRRLETPDPIDGADRARDPRTEAAAAFMRSAWSALECPAPPALRRGRRLRFPPALAAVAALVLALVGALSFHRSGPAPDTEPRAIASEQAATDETTAAPSADAAFGRRVTASGEIELRKGRLRLLLVKPTPKPTEDPEET